MLVPCDGCGRHIRETDDRCPFCDGGTPTVRKVMSLMGAFVTPLVLAACYGAPPGEFEDLDGDGYADDIDCDDSDDTVHPDADEICDDGIDNDCDDAIDDADDECATDSGA